MGVQLLDKSDVVIGVLALQGAFKRHQLVFSTLGVRAIQVRTPRDLKLVNSLVIPGGESTTISQLLESSGLFTSISHRIDAKMPVFGTCAGMIMLARKIIDGRADQMSFGSIDIEVQRNAYGRQVDSFEANIEVVDFVEPFPAVFIRAPRIVSAGPNVKTLAHHGQDVVLARQDNVLVASFHPELSNDLRIHKLFLEEVCNVRSF